MKNDAIINGKQITLSDEERKAGEKFHLSRYPFAWVNNQLVFNDNTNDDRDHQHWLCEDYGLTVRISNALSSRLLCRRETRNKSRLNPQAAIIAVVLLEVIADAKKRKLPSIPNTLPCRFPI